jgi:nucleosome binding factor SPN SPT16 subunit
MKNYLVKEIAGFIDSNKKISHAKISSMLDHVLLDDKKRQKLNLPNDVLILLFILDCN